MPRPPTIPMRPAQQHASVPITARAALPTPQPARSVLLDLYRGAVWGDFDQDLGVAGAAAQSTIGFVPVAGTLAALRDLFACIGQRDPLGVVLNLLAIFPVLGGFAKIADAVHTLHRYHRAAKRRRQRAMRGAAYPSTLSGSAGAQHRRSGWASFGLSLLVICLATLYSVGVGLLFDYLWANGPTIQDYTLHGSGAWLAPLVLLPLGLLVGLVLTVAKRLWLGLTLLPLAIILGFGVAVILVGLT
jgi:hypothetical protein